MIVGQTDQSSVVEYLITLRHSKADNKVNLEPGGGVKNKLTAISHRDFGSPNIGWRDTGRNMEGLGEIPRVFELKSVERVS